MSSVKKFKHKKEEDVFPSTKELLMESIKAGLSPSEYVRRYFDWEEQAEIWNTAAQVIATVLGVKTEITGNNTLTAFIEFEVRSGKPNSEVQTVRIGIISSQQDPNNPNNLIPRPDPTNPNNNMCNLINSCIGKRAKITKGYRYSEKNDCDYAMLLGCEPIDQPLSSSPPQQQRPQTPPRRQDSYKQAYM